ncbi:MAG: cell division protein FtsZ [Candidatus Babeliales bacterium]
MIELEMEKKQIMPAVSIKVIGIGGAGGNRINTMIDADCANIELIAANTDAQALNLSKAHHLIQLGIKSTKGLGTGANPDLGKRAAEEDIEKVMEILADADIVFLTGGLGGGTGSGGLPVIARALKEKGILTVAVVTKPFLFEGKRRAQVAETSLELLRKEVDTLIVIPNQKLLEVADEHVSMIDAFAMINDVLNQSVKSIADIISKPGHINVDFADVRTIMKDMGLAVMGTGKACGQDRAQQAALQAIASPLLENMNISGARSVLFNITGGTNLGLHEINTAALVIYERADEQANIILGSVINPELTDEVIVTVIATGFDNKTKENDMPEIIKASIKIDQKEKELVKSEVKSDLDNATKENEKSLKKPYELLDIHNLDVPTFMRNDQYEK